jgi:hypothetical protein
MRLKPVRERIVAAVPAAVLAIFAIACAAGLIRILMAIAAHVPFDPNEGWNAYHALAAMRGPTLYPPPSAWFVNNYPPLSFYAVGLFGKVTGDFIIAGRLVALIAFAVLCVLAGLAARSFGAGKWQSVCGALLLASWLLLTSDYVGMDDPQMLGHALQLAALLFLLRGGRAELAVLLFVVSLFVKHNLLALPLATAAWVFVQDRQRGIRLALWGAAFGVAGLLLFRIAFGSSLLSHLASARTWSFPQMRQACVTWLAFGFAPLLLSSSLLRGRDSASRFCGLYAGFSLVLAMLFAGGGGVDANAFFDADIALCIAVALALSRLAAPLRALAAAALLVSLGAGLAEAANGEDWQDRDYWFHPLADERMLAADDIAFLRAHPGPALCESLALCYWAGKSAQVDVFNTGQEFATRARSDEAFIALLRGRHFAVIQFDTLEPFALTRRVKQELLNAYRIDHSDDDGVFLVPRR